MISKEDALLKQLFGKTGEKIYMEQPVYVDYGVHTTIGEGFYANFDCTLLDVARLRLGNNRCLVRNVSLRTSDIQPMPKRAMRVQNLEYRLRLAIAYGSGANVTVNPGVTIGDNTVIGSGSVVTKTFQVM